MNHITRIAALAAFAAVMSLGSAASALTVKTVWKGFVYSNDNYDSGGFGLGADTIVNALFTATVITKVTPANFTYELDHYNEAVGGSLHDLPVLMSGSVEINGYSRSIEGSYDSALAYSDQGPYDAIVTYLGSAAQGGNLLNMHASGDFLTNASFSRRHTHSPSDVLSSFGYLSNGIGALNLSVSSVTSGPVPEPATWALMIGGFGLAGAGLRRRRAAGLAP